MLIVRHAQRFKGKLSRVNANTELAPRKIKVKSMIMGEYSSDYTDIYKEFLWKNYWEIGNVEVQVKMDRITLKWMLGNIATEHIIRVIPSRSGTLLSFPPCPDQY